MHKAGADDAEVEDLMARAAKVILAGIFAFRVADNVHNGSSNVDSSSNEEGRKTEIKAALRIDAHQGWADAS